MDCPCPSWQVPCRHLAATCLRDGRVVRRRPVHDPGLARSRSRRAAPPAAGAAAVTAPHGGRTGAHQALAPTVAGFWTAGPRLAPGPDVDGVAPHRPDAVLEQLEPLDLTVGRYQVTDLLRAAYRAIADDRQAD